MARASITVESICNQALDIAGAKIRIRNIYDGTRESNLALDLYGQTRDMLLYELLPTWATKDAALTLLKSAPNIVNGLADYTAIAWDPNLHPELPYLYEFQLPSDCLRPLQIKRTPTFVPVFRPVFKPYRESTDSASGTRTILTYVDNVILLYLSTNTDPTKWHKNFMESVIMMLAKKFEAEYMPMQSMQQRQQGQQQGGTNANSAG